MTDMVLYKDKNLTMPFTIENIGDTEAGEVRNVDGWLANNTSFDIVRITYETFDDSIKVLGIPDLLNPKSSHIVTINYTPSLIRQEALDTFITFRGKKRIPPE